MEVHSISIGAFGLELSGDSPVLAAVVDELAPLRDSRAPDARLVLTARPPEEPPPDATLVGSVAAVEGRAWIRARATSWTLAFDLREEVPVTTVHIPRERSGALAELGHRARNRSFMSAPEQDAYLVIHFVVELLLLLFARDVALVHSSAVCRDGDALMLISTGGTGKTSGAGRLIASHGWKFLSDDIAPVTAGGEVVPWPRRVMIYPYNLAGAPDHHRRVFEDRSALDRAQWGLARALRGAKGPRRRVPPQQLFGADRLGSQAPVRWAVFLARWNGEDFRRDPIDAATLALRTRHILATEFGAPFHWLDEWSATGLCPCTPCELLDRQRELVARTLRRAEAHHDVRVPHHATPPALAAYLDALCA